MIQMIYVVGDSHTRTFANNSNFFPLFIGPGKEVCFVSEENFFNVKNKVTNIVSSIEPNAVVMFVLGEPDTRFCLGKGWTPWEPVSNHTIKEPYGFLDQSLRRYSEFLKWFKESYSFQPIVFNVVPTPRLNQNDYVQYINAKLQEFCRVSEIPFVDIQAKLISGGKLHEKFMGDVVHLSTSIQPLVEAELKELGFQVNTNQQKSELESKALQSDFVYDKRFGCFTYQPGKRRSSKIYRKCRSFLRSISNGIKNA